MYLLAQIWWLLLVAFTLGVLLGYVVWRACGLPRFQSTVRRDLKIVDDKVRALELDNARLDAALSDAARAITYLEAEKASAVATAPAPGGPIALPPAMPALPRPKSIVAPRRASSTIPPMPMPPNGNGAANGSLLMSPRNGKADNLRLIRGVGPRLEKILNSMGVFHFDQIANWTDKDLALVDRHLGDFAGRAVRDKWIDQSRKLAGLDDSPKQP